MSNNAVNLARELIKIPSYSGVSSEIIELLQEKLCKLDFECKILEFDGDKSYKVNNLHAIFNPNKSTKTIYFAGHTDIVKEGDAAKWRFPAFAAEINDGKIYGRGAADMKCAIACFVAAVDEFLNKNLQTDFGIGLIITNDEENDGINGTKKVLGWMQENQLPITYCLVGEPTNPKFLGEMIKIGRRGSASFRLKIFGLQGHVAYPDIALNPITILLNLLKILKDHKFDEGSKFFDASNLEITHLFAPDLGSNVIPGEAECAFNVRFNDHHQSQNIIDLVEYACKKTIGLGANYELQYRVSGESFLSNPNFLAKITANATKKITDHTPVLSTSGGTSDARFIKDFAEVVEIGLVNETAHKIDEFAKISEIEQLQKIYLEILQEFAFSHRANSF